MAGKAEMFNEIGDSKILVKAKSMFDSIHTTLLNDVGLIIIDGIIDEVGTLETLNVPNNCAELDLGDMTIMPGLVDAHMHFFGVPSDQLYTYNTESSAYKALRAAGEARKMLEAGVTTTRCLGSSISPALRRAINEGHIQGPQIIAAGEFICSTGGTWDHISFPIEVIKNNHMLADGVDGMREIVRLRIRQGANVIKVGLSKGNIDDKEHAWGDDPVIQLPSYSFEEITALTNEAHLNKLKVSAHCIGDEAVRNAILGKVDVIEHGYGINDDTRKMLVDNNILVVSTISQLYFHKAAEEKFNYPDWRKEVYKKHIDRMREDFEKGLKFGVRYALGTDLIGYPTHPQDQAAKEFELAHKWGMTMDQSLIAGTKVSAEALGLETEIGTLESGKNADIIGFFGDPTKDIKILQNVKFVMQKGKVIVHK